MQKIVHPKQYIYLHPIFLEIEHFFTLTSEKTAQTHGMLFNYKFDNILKDLHRLFCLYGGCDYDIEFVDKHYPALNLPKYDDKNIILCFSGGKDSCACLKHYKEAGYNVYLYHTPKINPSQNRDETNQSIEIAKRFNVPIYVEELKISGKHAWVEHPMKNMIIASGALQWGIKNNIGTKIAFGNYITSSIEEDNFGFCGGDDAEMWCVYENIIQSVIPEFEIDLVLENALHTMNIICPDKELLDLTVSCIGRASLRKRNHDWIENKFGVKLPKYRCGQCYKCCAEYIWMAEHGLQEYSKEYYLYCLKRLKANLDKERYITTTTATEVCERFGIDVDSKYLAGALAVGSV